MSAIFAHIPSGGLPEFLYSRSVRYQIMELNKLQQYIRRIRRVLLPYRDSHGLWLSQSLDVSGEISGLFIIVRGTAVPPNEIVERVDSIMLEPEGAASAQASERMLEVLWATTPNLLG